MGTNPVADRLTGGVDEFFSRTDSAGTTFPLTDALGSTVALTDSSGAIQTQYTYEPFGATTPSGATSSNWYQFTGRENDGTGLYYYRARYYSPRFQRFISEDPAGLAGGINFYAYVGDSPVNFGDPFGLKPNGCQAFYCSPLFWQGVGIAVLAVAAPEALPLEWAAEAETAGEAAQATRVFWSGGRAAEEAAIEWAKANGGVTLGMTEAGQAVDAATSGMDWQAAKPLWVAASTDFAAGASGDVPVFINTALYDSGGIFAETELDILLANPMVTAITIFLF